MTSSEPTRLLGRESDPIYGADIRYTFRVGSMEFTGDNVSFAIQSVNRLSAEEKVQKYPLGSTVSVYYDPNDATKSVLEPGYHMGAAMFFLFVGLVLLGGALLGRWSVARLKKEPSSAG